MRFRDQDALLPQHLAALGEDQLHELRLLTQLLCQFLRPLRSFDLRQLPHSSLGLRDDLLRDDDDVAGLQFDPLRDQLPDPIPLAHLGHALDGQDPKFAAHIPSAFAVRLARPGCFSNSLVSAITSAGVSRSSSIEGSSSTPKGTPAWRAASTWRMRLPSPKAGTIASGGLSSRALVPVPWRSGTTPT